MTAFNIYDTSAVTGTGNIAQLRAAPVIQRQVNYVFTDGSTTYDINAPILSNPSPAAGSNIAGTDAIGFDVTDAEGHLNMVTVAAALPTGVELVFDGTSLGSGYSAGSTVSAITNGKRFSIVRTANWFGAVTLYAFAKDVAGNTLSGSYAWSAPAVFPYAPRFGKGFG